MHARGFLLFLALMGTPDTVWAAESQIVCAEWLSKTRLSNQDFNVFVDREEGAFQVLREEAGARGILIERSWKLLDAILAIARSVVPSHRYHALKQEILSLEFQRFDGLGKMPRAIADRVYQAFYLIALFRDSDPRLLPELMMRSGVIKALSLEDRRPFHDFTVTDAEMCFFRHPTLGTLGFLREFAKQKNICLEESHGLLETLFLLAHHLLAEPTRTKTVNRIRALGFREWEGRSVASSRFSLVQITRALYFIAEAGATNPDSFHHVYLREGFGKALNMNINMPSLPESDLKTYQDLLNIKLERDGFERFRNSRRGALQLLREQAGRVGIDFMRKDAMRDMLIALARERVPESKLLLLLSWINAVGLESFDATDAATDWRAANRIFSVLILISHARGADPEVFVNTFSRIPAIKGLGLEGWLVLPDVSLEAGMFKTFTHPEWGALWELEREGERRKISLRGKDGAKTLLEAVARERVFEEKIPQVLADLNALGLHPFDGRDAFQYLPDAERIYRGLYLIAQARSEDETAKIHRVEGIRRTLGR